jgi:multidrug efflux pump subunit AcrB
VLLISLLMSWLTAVTVTPLCCIILFKAKPTKSGDKKSDPYGGWFYRGYRAFLQGAIRIRYLTVLVVFSLFGAAVYGFGFLPDAFFPWSSRPQLLLDVWMPQGSHIRATEDAVKPLEDYVMSMENTKSIASHVGSGGARYLLVYSPERPNTGYCQLIINVFDSSQIVDMMSDIESWMEENMPEALTYTKRFKLGPGEGGNIQCRFSGPDTHVLRTLAEEATAIMYEDPVTKYVRNGWNQPVKVMQPVLAEQQARRLGITRAKVARRLAASFQGDQVGVYREGTVDVEDRLIPIISRPPEEERASVDNIQDLQIYSLAADRMIPLRQVITSFETSHEEELIERRNRQPTMILHVDQSEGETSSLFARVRPRIEKMFNDKRENGEISGEYMLEWGGEYEDGEESIQALATSIPMFAVLMVLIVIGLFNNIRQPLIIWLTVPLALIGVSGGLLMFNLPFNFMAILGTLSLAGMMIKNAIVLIDELNSNLNKGLSQYQAIVDAAVSRMRPVMMAAATTVLGMLPLLSDIFFVSMAVAIMFGLTFATILTLVIVPVLYTVLYRVKREPA